MKEEGEKPADTSRRRLKGNINNGGNERRKYAQKNEARKKEDRFW
jgi:hypothetical protein